MDTADLHVFFNDEPAAIPSDSAEGWTYEAQTRRLRFNGAACERVKSGAVKDIDIVYGCPRPVVD